MTTRSRAALLRSERRFSLGALEPFALTAASMRLTLFQPTPRVAILHAELTLFVFIVKLHQAVMHAADSAVGCRSGPYPWVRARTVDNGVSTTTVMPAGRATGGQ
jgi:hypothetical protein